MKVCVVSYCDKMVGVQNCSNYLKMNDFFSFFKCNWRLCFSPSGILLFVVARPTKGHM